MKVVDLHSDMFTDIAWRRSRGETQVFDSLHYPRLKMGLIDTIICVFWVEPAFKERPLQRIREIYGYVMDDFAESKHVNLCKAPAGFKNSAGNEKINIVLGLEGISFLETDKMHLMERFDEMDEKGIGHMIMAWNEVNSFASGTGAVTAHRSPGLTRWGEEAVREAERLNWLVDVSHLDEKSFWDVYYHSENPIIASHSNARALCDHERNLTDEQLEAIASRDGIVGLNAFWKFIDPANPTVDRFIDHAVHIANLAGIESVGFGFDFIDYLMPYSFMANASGSTKGLEDVTKIPALLERMAARGFSDDEIEAISYGNAMRILLRE